MKRLFLLFFLVISLTALYLSFVSCKEGVRSRPSRPMNPLKMATDLQKQVKTNIKTRQRVAKK